MKQATRDALLAINKRFYDEYSVVFGQTREKPWPAWRTLFRETPELWQGSEPLRILDVGCGNGRFGLEAAQVLERPIHYVGLDQSQGLLEQARDKLSGAADKLELREADLGGPTPLPVGGSFDLIGMFGVLHHLPGEAYRRSLLSTLGRHLKSGGGLWASWWMLHKTPRFPKKVVPWERLAELHGESAVPELDDLESGDSLLSWQKDGFGLRYLHFPEQAELERLAELPGLTFLRSLESDGPTQRENLYLLWSC